MRLSTLGALVGLALAASGCQEQRSYAIRWRVEPRTGTAPTTAQPQDEEVSNASVCSRAGVSGVEVRVFDELNRLADAFERPCFPQRFRRAGGAIQGATLPPGDYTLVIAGTRANGLPWGTCPIDPAEPEADSACTGESVNGFLSAAISQGTQMCVDGACNVGLLSCDCAEFTVEAETLRRLPDFVLEAPPDCEDGIDGDEDGLVDQLDPGCQLGDNESTPVLIPELELSISVLSGNPLADCGNVGIGALGLSIDGTQQDPILCNVGTTRFSTPLAVGPHELSIVGIRSIQGAFTPVTVEKNLDFVVNELGVASPRMLELDFADIDLLEPLESQIQFLYSLALPGPEDEPEQLVDCSDSRVGATDFRYRVLDLGGQQVRGLTAPLDGSLTACSIGRVVSLEPLVWGGYTIEVEGFNADGDLCWKTDEPAPLTPTEAQLAVLQPEDDAPASCFNG